MTRILLVTFSLRSPSKDYSGFLISLRGSSLQWWHFIEQTCVVTTHLTAVDLSNLLLPHIERTDSLLVVEMSPEAVTGAQGWLPRDAWNWLMEVAAKRRLDLGAGSG